ncbi:hypothetical protein LINPERHAP1_LOCUS11613 [Linum perenne]
MVSRIMHMLRPSAILETSFRRCRLFMCTRRVTMPQTSSLVEDILCLFVFIVLSLVILCCLTSFSITKS